MWSYCGHFQIQRFLIVGLDQALSHLVSDWDESHIVSCVFLVSDFSYKSCHTPLKYRCLIKESDHIKPTYLTMSTHGQPLLPRCIILLNTDKDSFIWQVAWPLELIIDSNAIKKYNQVTYLHMVFSLKLHPCLHSPEFLLTSLRSQKCFLFVTTVLNSRAILLCKKPKAHDAIVCWHQSVVHSACIVWWRFHLCETLPSWGCGYQLWKHRNVFCRWWPFWWKWSGQSMPWTKLVGGHGRLAIFS
jgi:hypothetical protein